VEVTHLGCATMHQLVTGFLLVVSKVDVDTSYPIYL
jgi:hypothetical protein